MPTQLPARFRIPVVYKLEFENELDTLATAGFDRSTALTIKGVLEDKLKTEVKVTAIKKELLWVFEYELKPEKELSRLEVNGWVPFPEYYYASLVVLNPSKVYYTTKLINGERAVLYFMKQNDRFAMIPSLKRDVEVLAYAEKVARLLGLRPTAGGEVPSVRGQKRSSLRSRRSRKKRVDTSNMPSLLGFLVQGQD